MAGKVAAALLLIIAPLVSIRRGYLRCFILTGNAKQRFHLDICPLELFSASFEGKKAVKLASKGLARAIYGQRKRSCRRIRVNA